MKKVKFTTYTATFIHGIHDLKSTYPYYGEWHTYEGDVSEEEYLKDPEAYKKRIEKWNKEKLIKLEKEGLLGKEYTVEVKMVHNPMFDTPTKISDHPLTSMRVMFLDNSEYNGEAKISKPDRRED